MIKLISLLPTKYLAIAGAVLALSAGFYAGYRVAAFGYQNDLLEAHSRAEQQRIEDENRLAEIERKYLDAQQNIRVVYRDKIKEVVKYVNRDQCGITDDGMQYINAALRGPDQ